MSTAWRASCAGPYSAICAAADWWNGPASNHIDKMLFMRPSMAAMKRAVVGELVNLA